MFKKKKEKKKDQLTEDEYKRLVELEKQHGPQPTSTPRPFKFTKRKDSKRVNKLDISTPFAFQHVAQACPDDRMSVHSSSSSVTNEAKNESTSSKSSIGLSSNKEQRIYNSAPLNPINHFVNNHYSGSVHSSQNNLHRKDSIASHTQSLYQRNDDWAQRQPWKQSLSSLHSVQSNHDYPDPYNRCYPKENVFPKEIPVPPPDVAKLLAPKRRVTLNRRSDRGFGFSLRRSTISERCQTRRTVLFAEPGNVGCGLLPGDRLLGIDDYDVEHAQQEHAVQKIKSAGQSVCLTVQPIPELTELSVRSPDGNETYLLSDDCIRELSFKQSLLSKGKLLRVEDDVPDEEWESGERLWLIHRAGIALCRVLPKDAPGSGSLPDGKAKVKLEQDGSVLIVDEACTEPANPTSQDKSEDITHTTFLNESSSLHTLRQRYGGKLVHTFCGSNLITLNPRHQLAAYSDKVMSMFKGSRREELPPHVFSIAQSAYRKLMNTQRNQSIVPMGISGSGKSVMVEHCINYFIKQTSNGFISFDTFQAGWKLLEIFSTVETPAGRACSRDVKLFHLDFDKSGVLVSIEVQCALLDKNHVTSTMHDFSNYLALHMLAEGAQTELKKDLFMNEKTKSDNRYLPQKNFNHERSGWNKQLEKTKEYLEMMDAESSEIKYIWVCLATILHLGQSAAEKSSDNKRYQYVDPESGHRAACCLGVPPETLQKYLFDNVNPSSSRVNEGQSAIDALAEALYCEVYQTVYSIVNRKFKGRESGVHCISIGDFPGYQLGRHQSLSSLLYNYAHDRLLNLHDEKVFQDPIAHYDQEGLQLDLPTFDDTDSTKTVRIIDQQSQRRIGDDDIDGLTDQNGVIWLLEEEAFYPNSSAESFISKVLMNFGTGRDPYILPSDSRTAFKVRHQLGHYETEYETSNWLKQSREALPQSSNLTTLLHDSKKQVVKMCVAASSARGADFNRIGTIRRSSNLGNRRTVSSIPSNKRKSPTLNSKLSIDLIMDKIKRSDVHWITCLSPTLNPEQSALTEMPFLRMQLRGLRVIEAGRLIKQGYPDYLAFDEFQRKFSCLVSGKVGINDYHTKADITKIYAEALELERSQHRIGRSKIFFRPGILAKLESKRDQKLNILLTKFQGHCRGYVIRKKIDIMKVQTVAVRCIQRNSRSYFDRKKWPWWKLFTQIIPLIETHKTDLELKNSKSEIEELKIKLEQIQNEKDHFKEQAGKYELKASELTHDLLEEQNVAAEISEQLEIETKERLKLKEEYEYEKERAIELEKNFEKTDIEYAELRQRYNQTLETMNSTVVEQVENDAGGDSSNMEEVRAKYEHQIREVEYAKTKAVGELDEELEVLKSKLRHEEKTSAELKEELENKETDLSQAKKRNQRLLAELHDTKLQVEETQARNHELEKKQRKFDSEMCGQQAETTQHKIDKDKSIREKENLQAQLMKMKADLDQKIEDLDFANNRIQRLEEDVKDQIVRDDEDGNALNQLKRNKRELEQQLEELREELEETTSDLERAEQARDRLQVQNERDRVQMKSEMEAKDLELEESRSTLQKRIKNLENQLDDEASERKKIVEQRKEAESKLMHLQHSIPARNEEAERKLRRDIQRYRALLKDAQTQIEVLRNDSVSKAQLKQLQAQLEEASAHQQITTKSKKSIQFENEDLQNQIEEISIAKQEIERQLTDSLRERHELCNRIEEQEDELEETIQKYRQVVDQKNREQSEMVQLSSDLESMRTEKNLLEERVRALQLSNESYEHNYIEKTSLVRAEARMREFETKLEFEKSASKRLESQNQRLKDQIEKTHKERDQNLSEKDREKSASKAAKKGLQEAREDLNDAERKLSEARAKVIDYEAEIARLQSTNEALQQDLKLAFKRIADLQSAFEALEDSDVQLSDLSSEDEDDALSIYSSNLPPVSRLGGSTSRLDSDRPESSLTIGTLTSAISGVGTITGISTVGRSKSRMTGEQRKRHAQKQRKKLMKEMDQNIERQDSLSRAGSRPGSRGPPSRMVNDVDLNAKAAGAEFSMDLLSKKLSETVSQIDENLSRAGSPTGSCISEARGELVNMVSSFGKSSKRAQRKEEESRSRATSRAGSRVGSRAGSRANSVERIKSIEPRKQDPIMRRLEDIDPFELLHSTPEQLAKQLGVHRGKGGVQDINGAIEDIRSSSQMGRRSGRAASEEEIKREKAVKTSVFADVNKQINYMKTDHVRGKIFKRREGTTLGDSDEETSTRVSRTPKSSRKSFSTRGDSDDDLDDISPYDSISNAGHLRDRSKDFENPSGDIADDIVKSTMQMYQTDRKKFNKDVGMAHFDSDSDEEEKLYRAKKSAKKSASKKNKYLSDDDDDDEDIPVASSKKSSRRSSKYDLSDDVKSSRKKSILKYPDDDEEEDEEELLETARRRGKGKLIAGKTLEQRKQEDPMDLSSTRRRLMMPDPDDPLDPANIDKMLAKRKKDRKAVEGIDDDLDRPVSRSSSRASNAGEDWLAMAARAAQMSQELSKLDAAPIDQDKFDRVYNDVLTGTASGSPPSDPSDDEEEDFDKFSSTPSSNTKPEPVTDKPKFRSRFLDRVRGKIDSESPDKSQKKMAEDYVRQRSSRMSGDSRGSSERNQSRVSFADQQPTRSRAQSYDEDDDVSLARFGVRCETLTPTQAAPSKKKEGKTFEPKSDRLKSVMSSYLK